MPSYVKSITIPGMLRNQPIEFAFPATSHEYHIINVLCGQNNTGKSFALEGLRQCLQLRWAHTQKTTTHTTRGPVVMDSQNGLHKGDIYVTMSLREPQPITLSFCGSSWKYMSNAGIIGLTSNPKKAPTNHVAYTELFSRFAYQQIQACRSKYQMPTVEEWLDKSAVRQQVLRELEPNSTLYKCNANNDLISVLEFILGGHLYFRYVKVGDDTLGQIDFSLVYGDGSSRVYTEWSDGQRSVFYFLTLINEIKPEVRWKKWTPK